MRCLTFILAAALTSYTSGSTAQTTVPVKIQFQHADLGFAKRLRVSVNNQLYITNDSGFLKLALPKTVGYIKIALPLSSELVLYPPNGQLPIPKDVKQVPLVIVGSKEAHYQLRKYLDLREWFFT